MFATAIIGRTVGVKYARRRSPRPGMRSFTQTAISSAMTMDAGIVPTAYQTLFDSACQNTGSSTSCR